MRIWFEAFLDHGEKRLLLFHPSGGAQKKTNDDIAIHCIYCRKPPDSAFERLTVWTPGQDGIGGLTSLRKSSIGAIYLGNAQTSFDIKGKNQELQGRIQNTGVFLFDNGRSGSVQQLDLAV